jgi:hypothetical protein
VLLVVLLVVLLGAVGLATLGSSERTDGPMPTHYKDPVIACDGCGATTDRPVGREGQRALYEQGWRGRGNPDEKPMRFAPHTHVWLCPTCRAGGHQVQRSAR